MLSRHYIVIIPAYNEESCITIALDSIYSASLQTKGYKLEKIIICLNGCTDKTKEKARLWSKAPLDIIESDFGYINAMNKLFRHAQKYYPKHILVKTDADSRVDKKAFTILFRQFEIHKKIVVVGGHPLPILPHKTRTYRDLMAKILSIRSHFPEAEITIKNTEKFHPYANLDPIPRLHGREKLLKIHFHGRLWSSRTSDAIPQLPKKIIGDDVFLPGWLLNKYGPESMRLDYRANVYFYPNNSLTRHWKVYRRINEDCQIVYKIKDFSEYANICSLKLDWKYIFLSCNLKTIICFFIYSIITYIEKKSYKLTSYSITYWQYDKKEN